MKLLAVSFLLGAAVLQIQVRSAYNYYFKLFMLVYVQGISFRTSAFIVTNLLGRTNRDVLSKGVDYFCVKRLHLDREHLQYALHGRQFLNEDDIMVKRFLTCSWNLSGRIFSNGRINFRRLGRDVSNGFVKSGIPKKEATFFSAVILASCRGEQDVEAAKIDNEVGIVRVVNCISKYLNFIGKATKRANFKN